MGVKTQISDTLGNNNNDFPVAETQNLVSIKDMEEIFNGANCGHLLKKPKLFILQCCRGGLYLCLS